MTNQGDRLADQPGVRVGIGRGPEPAVPGNGAEGEGVGGSWSSGQPAATGAQRGRGPPGGGRGARLQARVRGRGSGATAGVWLRIGPGEAAMVVRLSASPLSGRPLIDPGSQVLEGGAQAGAVVAERVGDAEGSAGTDLAHDNADLF